MYFVLKNNGVKPKKALNVAKKSYCRRDITKTKIGTSRNKNLISIDNKNVIAF